jgi:O-methyltransferase
MQKYGVLKRVYEKIPILQPFFIKVSKPFFDFIPKFSGWGMKTGHELPWNDEYDWKKFRETQKYVKEKFDFSNDFIGMSKKNIDKLLYRHWYVNYCVRHAIEFAKSSEYNFVECGTANGVTAFFALKEIENNIQKQNFLMHLYDSWGSMQEKDLLETEMNHIGNYSELDINRTKKNLKEFEDKIIYHIGYIPESLDNEKAPKTIVYMHIDLNSAMPTLASLEFFFPRLVRGGVILFDDYGQEEYKDTKKITDKFFSDKPGMLLKLPTSQAIYFR